MFSEIKSKIPKSKDIILLEEETLIYDEGEPFLYETAPYSTFLFIFPDEQFSVYSIDIKQAIKHVEELKGGSEK